MTDPAKIAWVTIEGSGRHNLLTVDAIRRLIAVVEALGHSSPSVVLLKGRGSFSAGADLAEISDMTSAEFTALLDLELNLCDLLEALPCPTVAVVEGLCQGSGAELALACDLRIAARSARFALPETAAGFPAPVHRLARAVPAAVAADIVFTGRRLDAVEGLRVGLYSRVVADDELGSDAGRLADRLAAARVGALRTTKDWLARAYAGESVQREELRAMSGSIFADWKASQARKA